MVLVSYFLSSPCVWIKFMIIEKCQCLYNGNFAFGNVLNVHHVKLMVFRAGPAKAQGLPRVLPLVSAALSWRDPRLSCHPLWGWVTSLEARFVLPGIAPLVPSPSCLLFQVTVFQIIFVLFLTSLEAAGLSVPQSEGRWLGFSRPQGASCRAFLGLFFTFEDFPRWH